jgi:hypothetical protein
MHTGTDARARSERVESFLRGGADFVVEPAGREESVRERDCVSVQRSGVWRVRWRGLVIGLTLVDEGIS